MGAVVLFGGQTLAGGPPAERTRPWATALGTRSIDSFDAEFKGKVPVSRRDGMVDLSTVAVGNARRTCSPFASAPIVRLNPDKSRMSGAVPVFLQQRDDDLQFLYVLGQTGCLTASTQAFAYWLHSYDFLWNDGC